MNVTDEHLLRIRRKNGPIKVMIVGLGSVGLYLLDYLLSLGNPDLELIAVGRNLEKMQSDVNIVRVAAAIRGQNRSLLTIDGTCDLEEPETVAACISRHTPDMIVNTSRVYAGLKYGSISWKSLRAYGIWTPLAVKYITVIMRAVRQADSHAVVINTSYSDAVIPWLKSAGEAVPDFGSGNVNHLVPRIRLAVSEMAGIPDPWNLDITLAAAHFHDVVISKEGQTEGVEPLLSVFYRGAELTLDYHEIYHRCKIAMPVDAKRNMMNASSNFEIITGVLRALNEHEKVKLHIPGAFGELGGFPVCVDGKSDLPVASIDTSVFSYEDMVQVNRRSLALDGIENVCDGALIYTDLLLDKVKNAFGVTLPKRVLFADRNIVAKQIIDEIIVKNI